MGNTYDSTTGQKVDNTPRRSTRKSSQAGDRWQIVIEWEGKRVYARRITADELRRLVEAEHAWQIELARINQEQQVRSDKLGKELQRALDEGELTQEEVRERLSRDTKFILEDAATQSFAANETREQAYYEVACTHIVDWTLEDDDGQKLPANADTINDTVFDVIYEILQAIQQKQTLGRQEASFLAAK